MLGRSLLRLSAPGVLLAILCLTPFLNKAYTIDDPVFLKEAHQALRTPLTPAATSTCWDDIPYPRPLRQIGSVGLVMGYALVPVALLGDREWVAHLIMLLMVCASVIATVSLALYCGTTPNQAMLAGLFLASFPVVLAMAGTVMPDLLAATLAIIGLERLMAWKADGRLSQGLAAAVALGLAPVARSHTLLLLPIGAFMLAGKGWPRRVLPIPLAVVIFAAVTWITSDQTASQSALFAGGPNAEQFGSQYIFPNALEFGMNWIAVTPLAIAWLLLDGFAGMALIGAALIGGTLLNWLAPSTPVLVGMCGIAGWLAAASACRWAWRHRRFDLMGLALCLLITIPMIPYKHLPSRYILPGAPAAAIFLAMRIGDVRWRKPLSMAITVCGAALGIAILHADATFAGLTRRVVAENIAPHLKSGHAAWYAGQWGLVWYAERAGAACLTVNLPQPRSGDLVVAGEIDGGVQMLSRRLLKLRTLRKIQMSEPCMRIMNQAAHAGFFGNSFGYLPWRLWSDEPVNTYYVWLVE